MASTSEVGHAKNIANFHRIITFVQSYRNYNPSKRELQISELNNLLNEAQNRLDFVLVKNVAFNNAVNNRIIEFSDLKPLATRLVNALQVSNANQQLIKDAVTINRKLQGGSKAKPAELIDQNKPAPKTISTSQQSYDQQIQHFAALIAILASEPSYSPNETELTIDYSNQKQNNLIAKNNAVSEAYTIVSNARIDRNKILYNPENGIVATAIKIKKYIKSIYGAQSPEYEQISSIIIRPSGL